MVGCGWSAAVALWPVAAFCLPCDHHLSCSQVHNGQTRWFLPCARWATGGFLPGIYAIPGRTPCTVVIGTGGGWLHMTGFVSQQWWTILCVNPGTSHNMPIILSTVPGPIRKWSIETKEEIVFWWRLRISDSTGDRFSNNLSTAAHPTTINTAYHKPGSIGEIRKIVTEILTTPIPQC
jgi:hypothetical protein